MIKPSYIYRTLDALKGRCAVVTGASSGIGAAIANELSALGMRVFGWDRNSGNALGNGVMALTIDITDEASVVDGFVSVLEETEQLDVLVNCAGIGGIKRTRYMASDEWGAMLNVHATGSFLCAREALASMETRGYGSIINIASICGLTGCAYAAHYSAAKGAILGMTKALAREAIKKGVRVNAIAPGYIETPLLSVLSDAQRQAILAEIPSERFGTEQEVLGAAVFLASDASSFMVGQVVSPNGGQVI